MRKTTRRIICLLIFLIVTMNYSASEGENMKQNRPNKLKKLYFVPQHGLIAAACNSLPNGSIRLWSINDGKLGEIIDLKKREWADSLAISNDGKLVAAALLGTKEIGCYSLKEKKWVWRRKSMEKGIAGDVMQFTLDDRKLVVVGFRNIVIYDTGTGAVLQKQEDSTGFSSGFPEYRTRINGISPSARYAAFWQGILEHDEGRWSSKNIWVSIRDIETGKTIAKQGKIQDKYKNCSATFTPDEKNLLLGSMDGYVRVWSIAEQKVIKEWKAYWHDDRSSFEENPAPNEIDSMTFSPDGRYLSTMGHLKGGSAVRIWDYTANKLTHEFNDVISSSLPMCSGYPTAFSLDGKYFALEQQGKLCLYDTQTWKEKWCVPTSIEGKD